jgi:hypothetical protein
MKVFSSDTDLYKFENFGKLIINEKIDRNDLWGEGSNWKLFLKENKELKKALKKIGKDCFGKGYSIKEDMFCLIQLIDEGEYNKMYVSISGDSSLNFSENLEDKFVEDYNSEEKWGVKRWKEL